MASARPERRTSAAQVTNVSRWGFWLLLGERELFVSFEMLPKFREVPIGKLVDVTIPHPGHLYWPELDENLGIDSIKHPDHYPIVNKSAPRVVDRPSRRPRL